MIARSVVVNKKTGNRGYFYQCPRCGKKVRYDAKQNASDLVCKNCGDLRLILRLNGTYNVLAVLKIEQRKTVNKWDGLRDWIEESANDI